MTVPFLLYTVASHLANYPTDDAAEGLSAAATNSELVAAARAINAKHWDAICACQPLDVQALQGDYIDIFDHGKERNAPYETEYGNNRSFRKTTDLADICGFYKAFGLELQPGERPDHIGVELEFYGYLLAKEAYLGAQDDSDGVEVVSKARQSFLADHLSRFVEALADRPQVAAHPYFGPVFGWVSALVLHECELYAITPEPIELDLNGSEDDAVKCGACPAQSPLSTENSHV